MATIALPEASQACQPQAAPASRASWCGQLRLGTLCVPVKAYAAIATPPEIPLRQLHAVCGARIEYRTPISAGGKSTDTFGRAKVVFHVFSCGCCQSALPLAAYVVGCSD